MADDREERAAKHRGRMMRSAGYFQCKRVIAFLREFQDLVRHDFRFESQHAHRTLEVLVPGSEVPANRERLLHARINQLIPRVRNALWVAGIRTDMVSEEYEGSSLEDPKKVERRFDLIEHYFDHNHDLQSYRYVIQALDRGIGVFEQKERHEFRQLFNPVTYLAWCLRLPITILERAGIDVDEASSVMIRSYGWLVRLVMLLLLALLAKRLGITGVWDKVIQYLSR
jgi:hypothetical protein